jgi:hypothetical protein
MKRVLFLVLLATSVAGAQQSAGYIPPDPQQGTKERLTTADINAVVLNAKPAIMTCINEQKRKNPGLTGTLQMRWTIQPTGRTTGVSVTSTEFRSTYMASCLSGLIRGWSFPRHRVQGPPVDFPFKF